MTAPTSSFHRMSRIARVTVAQGLLGQSVYLMHDPGLTGEAGPARIFIGHALAVAAVPGTEPSHQVPDDLLVLSDSPYGSAPAIPLRQVHVLLQHLLLGNRCRAWSDAYGCCELAAHNHATRDRSGQAHRNRLGGWYRP